MIRLLNLTLRTLKIDNNEIIRNDDDKADKMVKNLFKFKKLKNMKSKV